MSMSSSLTPLALSLSVSRSSLPSKSRTISSVFTPV